jgi:hypothetical protein
MSSTWSIQAPTLVGSNYDFWSEKVKAILQGQGCWVCVETGFIELDANVVAAMTVVQRKTLEELKKKEGKAKSYILVSLDDSIFPKIIGAKTAKEAWDILKLADKDNDKVKTVRFQTLRTQFETLKMSESETVDQFMTKVMGIINRLRTNGEKELTNQRVVEKVLRSLPKKFEMVVTALLESKDLTNFSIEELTGSLLSYEARMTLDLGTLEHAFQTKVSMDRGRGRGFHGRGRGRSQTRDKPEQTKDQLEQSRLSSQDRGQRWTSKSVIQCHYCKMLGHHISECRKLQFRNKSNVTESETSDTLFLSCQVSQEILDKDVWLLDSGCSNHMTGHNDLLSNLDTTFITTISLGDDHSIKTSGKCVVPVLTKQGEVKNIPDVYYVPNNKHNFLSIGKLMAHGYDVNFHNNICTILNQTKRLVEKSL